MILKSVMQGINLCVLITLCMFTNLTYVSCDLQHRHGIAWDLTNQKH
jgi:hypothetical protein